MGLPNKPRDSRTWSNIFKRLLNRRAEKTSLLMREISFPSDSKTLLDPKEELSELLAPLSKTPSTKNSEKHSVCTRRRSKENFTKCMSIVNTVKDNCMKLAAEDESKAFFQKMIGDYYRYVAESASPDKIESVKKGALAGYNEA